MTGRFTAAASILSKMACSSRKKNASKYLNLQGGRGTKASVVGVVVVVGGGGRWRDDNTTRGAMALQTSSRPRKENRKQ